jgi:hypothetical protein
MIKDWKTFWSYLRPIKLPFFLNGVNSATVFLGNIKCLPAIRQRKKKWKTNPQQKKQELAFLNNNVIVNELNFLNSCSSITSLKNNKQVILLT